MPSPSALTIANELLNRAQLTGRQLTPMQVIKLAYIAHGWHLAVSGEPLFYENVEAWQYGPVIPNVYREFKHFGRDPILTLAQAPAGEQLPSRAEEVLQYVIRNYGDYTGVKLSALTHTKGTPWDQTWDEGRNALRNSVVIPNELIRNYYTTLAQQAQAG